MHLEKSQKDFKGTGRVGNKPSGNHPNYSIVNIGHNTEKSPGDLRTLTSHSRGKLSAFANVNKSQKAWIDYKKAYDMIPQSWIINCLKMYKIWYVVINVIEKTMKTWRVELTAEGRSLAETKIQRGIFQDALSPLLFVIAMMPLNNILRKYTAGLKLCRSQEKINHLMHMDDIKIFAKNDKINLENLIHAVRVYIQDIGMEFGIEKRAMLVMKSSRRHLTDGIKISNQDKIRTLGDNETYKYLGILEADTIKNWKWKTKCRKNISGELENYSGQNSVAETLQKE